MSLNDSLRVEIKKFKDKNDNDLQIITTEKNDLMEQLIDVENIKLELNNKNNDFLNKIN